MAERIMRRDVTFQSEGDRISAWFYEPAKTGTGPAPGIVMAHGFGATKTMRLDSFATRFAAAGFAVVVFDYRRLGESGGVPRQEIDPATQIEDYRNAITWLSDQPGVDAGRIGIWGTSYSGGHVLVVGATDARVKCVVAQVPTISGFAVGKRRFGTADVLAKLNADLHADRLARLNGGAPEVRPLVAATPDDVGAIYSAPDAVQWYVEAGVGGGWVNQATLRSVEYSRAYEPGAYVSFISPRPLLMIVAREDFVTPTDLALSAFETAREPKKLVLVPGGHFEPYGAALPQAAGAALDWFVEHL
ncbi:MAG: hypothetical protein BGP04_01015 [Rhizobiales bacterium 62-17]|nr:MAG: hypothetical protein BGP04_01015 [Rhizobiales bacterium 62-17]